MKVRAVGILNCIGSNIKYKDEVLIIIPVVNKKTEEPLTVLVSIKLLAGARNGRVTKPSIKFLKSIKKYLYEYFVLHRGSFRELSPCCPLLSPRTGVANSSDILKSLDFYLAIGFGTINIGLWFDTYLDYSEEEINEIINSCLISGDILKYYDIDNEDRNN